MRIYKKIVFLIIAIFLLVVTVNSSLAQKVSVSQNLIEIVAFNTTSCQGSICEIEFEVNNLDNVNRDTNIAGVFYNEQVKILKLERYGEYSYNETINQPYQCNCYQDVSGNGTIQNVCQTCDDYVTIERNVIGYYEIPINSNVTLFKSKAKEKLKFSNQFKVTVSQPLGQFNKYDLKTFNWDNTETTLDPWIDSNNYYINLTNYSLRKDIIRMYYFNESTGTNLIDKTGNVNATVSSASVWTNGKLNLSNVSNSYINFSNLEVKPNFSISFVYTIQGYSTQNNPNVLGFNGANGKTNLYFYKDAYGSANALVIGKTGVDESASNGTFWGSAFEGQTIKLGLTWNGTHVCFYKNSLLDKCNAYTTTVAGSFNYVMGYRSADAQTWFKAIVSNLSIYNRTLSSSEISQLHNLSGDPYKDYTVIISNIYDNLSINSTLQGIQVSYNSSIINQLNDSALGNNLISGQCYSLLNNTLNWSINVNVNYSQDLSNVVQYNFTTCTVVSNSSGGGSSLLNLAVQKLEKSHLWIAIKHLINYPMEKQSYLNVQREFDLWFYNQLNTNALVMPSRPVYYTTNQDLQASFNLLIEHPSGQNFGFWLKKFVGYGLTNINMQVVQ